MSTNTIVTGAELAAHNADIEQIHADAFGPGRFARAAFRIREGGPHEQSLSRVATVDGKVIASVRMTPVMIGPAPALLLGPLAVAPAYMNRGIGRNLMKECLALARQAGHVLVILVGDEPYYSPFGFKRVPAATITFPAPVDQNRILICGLIEGAADGIEGEVRHAAL
ncbi:MAG: N-acetyltransferase [Rhizobiaceae bacterium]